MITRKLVIGISKLVIRRRRWWNEWLNVSNWDNHHIPWNKLL
jgi:hypothetical protein